MAEKGLSALDIVEIAEAMEVRSDPTAAERQQRRRDRMKAERDASHRDVTCDVPPVPSPFFPPDPQSTPIHTPEKDTPRARKAENFPVPDGVEAGHWHDFLANRKAKRLTNTATAYAGVLRDIAKHQDDDWPPGRLVQFAAEKGWGSINNPRNQDIPHGHQSVIRPQQFQQKSSAADRLFDAIAAEAAERDDNPSHSGTGREISAQRWNQ
jgi:hypothetical protein